MNKKPPYNKKASKHKTKINISGKENRNNITNTCMAYNTTYNTKYDDYYYSYNIHEKENKIKRIIQDLRETGNTIRDIQPIFNIIFKIIKTIALIIIGIIMSKKI